MSPRVAIVGGGISGLSAALRLREARPDLELVVFERDSRLGGVLQTVREQGLLLEEGPDSLVRTKPEGIALAERLGVELIPTSSEHSRSMVVHRRRLLPIPEGFVLLAPTSFGPLITTPLFSLPGKVRMAMDVLLPRKKGDEDETLAAFVRRRLGEEALERLAQPLLGGVVAGDPEELSLQATMPMLAMLEKKHRSVILGMRARQKARGKTPSGEAGARYGLFLTPKEGMSSLVTAIEERLGDRVQVRFGADVRSVRAAEGATWVATDGAEERYDGAVVALPIGPAGRVLEDEALRAELAAIPASSTATLNLVYRASDVKHPLDAFGFVAPAGESLALMACTFTTRKYPGRAPDDRVVIRAFVGGVLGQEAYGRPDDELVAAVRRDLESLLGLDAEPVRSHLVRWDGRFPRFLLGHRERMARVRARLDALPGLAVAGNFFDGAGVPDCVRAGTAAADKLLADLALG